MRAKLKDKAKIVLESKTKPELITVAKKVGLKGYSRKNRRELVSYLLSNLSGKDFEVLLGVRKTPFYMTGWFFFLLSTVLAISLYLVSKIDNQTQNMEQNQIYLDNKDLMLKNSDYAKKLLESKELNINLLKGFFDEYVVYGVRNEKVVIPEKKGQYLALSKLKSSIRFDTANGTMKIVLNINELRLKGGRRISNSYATQVAKIPKPGEPIKLPSFGFEERFYIMMLNQDLVNPIIVLGLK